MPFSTNEDLVQHLLTTGVLKTPVIIQAFKAIDRAIFVPSDLQAEAYADHPLPIGYGQTISQPSTVAFMLELLQPFSNIKILEIGSGSGYVTALLSKVVGKKGKIIAVERKLQLLKSSEQKINHLGLDNVDLIHADGSRGYHLQAPYRKIIVSAAAPDISKELLKQLDLMGTMVIPIGREAQSIVKLEKTRDGYTKKIYPGFIFVPLVTD